MKNDIHNLIVSFVKSHGALTKYQLTQKIKENQGLSHRDVNKYINDLVKQNVLEFYSTSGNVFLRPSLNKHVPISDHITLSPEKMSISSEMSSQDKIYIQLSSGTSFGDGSHPTTVLCLKYIDSLFSSINDDISSWKILDLGSGSGILAVACGLFGVGYIDICDIDDNALYESRQNLIINNVQAKPRFYNNFDDTDSDYNLIVANLRYPSLIDFQMMIKNKLTPKSVVILSGIKQDEYTIISKAYDKNFVELGHRFEKNWCSVFYNLKD